MKTIFVKIYLSALSSFLLFSNAYADIANKGIVCINQEQLASDWSKTEAPLISSVAHWFNGERVSTSTWSRANDTISMTTTRKGVPFETDAKTIRWKTTVEGEDRVISIDRATAMRSVLSGEKILVSADCKIFLEEKKFKERLEEITNTLQTKFDKAISKHKL